LLQALQAFRLCGLVDLIVHRGAWRSGPRRIFEGERAGKTYFVDQAERGVEIAFRLAREADDEIGRQRQIGPRAAQPADKVKIIRAPVPADAVAA
jgi:hypothetical protein